MNCGDAISYDAGGSKRLAVITDIPERDNLLIVRNLRAGDLSVIMRSQVLRAWPVGAKIDS